MAHIKIKKEKHKKGYSNYSNSKSKMYNAKPVNKGSVIVAKLSDYENLPRNVIDHKRESVVVLKGKEDDLGVVYLHGVKNIAGKSREKKKESGLWEEINKNGQKVYVDLDIKVTDAKGNLIKQGKVFQNTGVIIDPEEMKKVESHIYGTDSKTRVKGAYRTIRSNRATKTKKTK